MKFVDGLMIHSGEPAREYVDTAVRHVLLRQGKSVSYNKSQFKRTAVDGVRVIRVHVLQPHPLYYCNGVIGVKCITQSDDGA